MEKTYDSVVYRGKSKISAVNSYLISKYIIRIIFHTNWLGNINFTFVAEIGLV
jgi:hypothetical protein